MLVVGPPGDHADLVAFLVALILAALPSCALSMSFDGYGSVPTTPERGVRAASAGFRHNCAVLASGEVRCWGWNDDRQLGDGTRVTRGKPVVVNGVTKAVAVAVGYRHSCALRDDSTVICWGANSVGQLGDGTEDDRGAPGVVENVVGATAIAAGDFHTCAIVSGGQVRCWGLIPIGKRYGSENIVKTPAAVPDVSGAKDLAASGGLTCALLTNGEVRCWGAYDGAFDSQQPPTPHTPDGISGATGIGVSGGTACAIVDGVPRCWGGSLELGFHSATPVPSFAVDAAAGATNVFGMGEKMCATLASHDVVCWSGTPRELGNVQRDYLGTPLFGASGLVAGFAHACGFLFGADGKTERRLRCWDNGYSGGAQVGDDSFRVSWDEKELSSSGSFVMGGRHRCAAGGGDGSITCWGANDHAQVGSGQIKKATDGTALASTFALAAGGDHTCAIVVPSPGSWNAWCWGRNEILVAGKTAFGALGDPARSEPSIADAIRVQFPAGVEPKEVTAGWMHTCALGVSDGKVYCWGANAHGELGSVGATSTDTPWSATPIEVPGVVNALSVVAGHAHTCALLSSKVVCWGGYDKVDTTSSIMPTILEPFPESFVPPAGNRIRSLAAGSGFTCALLENGDVICWGVSASRYPAQTLVAQGASALAVAGTNPGRSTVTALDGHVCILVDHTVRCAGDNGSGQLGDGSERSSDQFVDVLDVSDVSDLPKTLGSWSSCAAIATRGSLNQPTRTARCWGDRVIPSEPTQRGAVFVAELP